MNTIELTKNDVLKHSRMTGIDLIRVFAALGVVWAHLSKNILTDTYLELAAFGWFAVPFFIIISLLFFFRDVQRESEGKTNGILLSRCNRILRPWLLWSCIFVVLEYAKYQLLQKNWAPPSHMLLMGGNPMYWFLPFIFASFLILYPVYRVIVAFPIVKAPIAIGLACLSVYLYSLPDGWLNAAYDNDKWPLRWEKDIPLVPLAGSISLYVDYFCRYRKKNLLYIGFFALSLFGFYGVYDGIPGSVHFVGFSLAFTGIAMTGSGFITSLLAPLSKYTFLIYLVHEIVLWPFYSLHKYLIGKVNLGFAIVEVLIVFLICLATAKLIHRYRIFKPLVP